MSERERQVDAPRLDLLAELPASALAEALLRRLQKDSSVHLERGEIELRVLLRDGRFQRGRANVGWNELRR